MDRKSKEAGYTILLLAASATVLFAFTGMGVDVGYLQLQKRRMQVAADAGAVAAAQELLRGNTTSYGTYAKNDASANGFTDGSNSTTVIVNNPPTSGAYSGLSSYVQVFVEQPQNTYFMRILGFNSVNEGAQSVAALGNSGACVYLLDPSMRGAYHSDGGTSLTADCGMKVNSSDSLAIDNQGSTTMQGAISVVGGYSNQATLSPTPSTGTPAITDPLARMAAPSQPGAPVGNSAILLHPGYYNSGINIGQNAIVTMAPGLYYLNGNLSVGQAALLTGSGVTIYLTGQLYGNTAQLNLSAPTASSAGAIEGIVVWSTLTGGPSAQCVRLESNTQLTLTGVVYCPQSQVYIESHSVGYAAYTQIVAQSLDFRGSTSTLTIHADYSSLLNGNPIKDIAALAE